jgi:hypothetical protein
MADRSFYPPKGSMSRNLVTLTGKFVTTTGGTIGSSDCDGFSIAKTGSEAGRYTVTLGDKYSKLRGVVANVKGAADAAYTTAKGLNLMLRNDAVATSKTFDIQFVRTDTAADAELEDAAEVYLTFFLKDA